MLVAVLACGDLAYPETLYEGIPNIPAASKIADVGRQMERRAER
jgi:hypothetical protein